MVLPISYILLSCVSHNQANEKVVERYRWDSYYLNEVLIIHELYEILVTNSTVNQAKSSVSDPSEFLSIS